MFTETGVKLELNLKVKKGSIYMLHANVVGKLKGKKKTTWKTQV